MSAEAVTEKAQRHDAILAVQRYLWHGDKIAGGFLNASHQKSGDFKSPLSNVATAYGGVYYALLED